MTNCCPKTQCRIVERGIDYRTCNRNNWRQAILEIDAAVDLRGAASIAVAHLKSIEPRREYQVCTDCVTYLLGIRYGNVIVQYN